MGVFFDFSARGHVNVLASHPTTTELTREDFLTRKGNCIVGVCCSVGASTLPAALKRLLARDEARVVLTLESGGVGEVIRGRGSSLFSFENPLSMVFRKSEHVDDRTVMVGADKASCDLDRRLVGFLEKGAVLRLRLDVS